MNSTRLINVLGVIALLMVYGSLVYFVLREAVSQ